VLIQSPKDLDDSTARGDAFLSRLGAQSSALVPLLIGGSVLGFVGFDLIRRRQPWSEEMAVQLKLVGEVFSSALDRKRAEEALITSETRYRNLLESSGLAIAFLDAEGRYSIVNKAMAALMGNSADQLLGRHIEDVYTAERASRFHGSLRRSCWHRATAPRTKTGLTFRTEPTGSGRFCIPSSSRAESCSAFRSSRTTLRSANTPRTNLANSRNNSYMRRKWKPSAIWPEALLTISTTC
jgi:PAS domain S-box-containing protein